MKKIYHLSSCSTCVRIIKDLELKDKKFEFQDIKTQKITPAQLEEMKKLAGNYESLFSRVAQKYKALKLGEQSLTENDYKNTSLKNILF